MTKTNNLIIDKSNFRVKEFDTPNAKRIVFVFTAMGTKIGLYRLFVRTLVKRGYSVIVYDYPLSLLFNARLPEWEKFYGDIISDSQERLSKFEKKGISSFCAYGVSMGTLIANKFTRDTPKITHLILNLTYGDVAHSIFTYRGVKKTKDNLLKQGIDEAQLRQRIQYSNPINHVNQLKGKKVLLYLSKNDQILKYKDSKHTKAALEDVGIDLTYVENKVLGHYLGATKNMLIKGKMFSFLEKL